jgi:hypothetical protein
MDVSDLSKIFSDFIEVGEEPNTFSAFSNDFFRLLTKKDCVSKHVSFKVYQIIWLP